MDKTIVYVVLGIVGLIILFNLSIIFIHEIVYSIKAPYLCAVLFIERDRCFADSGISSNSIWACRYAGHLQGYCYRDTATIDNYRENCEKADLKSFCYRTFAQKLGNESICLEKVESSKTYNLFDDRSWCILDIAKDKGDVSICDKIEINDIHLYCLFLIESYPKNESFCYGFSDNAKDMKNECLSKLS